MSPFKLFAWVVGGYCLLALSPLFIALVADKLVIPAILWMHKVGILRAKP